MNQLIAILTNFKDLGEWSKTIGTKEKELEKKLETATSKLKYLQSGEYRTKLLAETLSKYIVPGQGYKKMIQDTR